MLHPTTVLIYCPQQLYCWLDAAQGETKVLPTYNAHSTKAAAINLIDLPAFLLARYVQSCGVETPSAEQLIGVRTSNNGGQVAQAVLRSTCLSPDCATS